VTLFKVVTRNWQSVKCQSTESHPYVGVSNFVGGGTSFLYLHAIRSRSGGDQSPPPPHTLNFRPGGDQSPPTPTCGRILSPSVLVLGLEWSSGVMLLRLSLITGFIVFEVGARALSCVPVSFFEFDQWSASWIAT